MLIKITTAIFCSLLMISTAACHKDDDDDDDDDDSEVVTPKSDAGGVLTATISADSSSDQVVNASAGSPVDGVSITFSPGSLAVSTDITLEAGLDVVDAAVAGELGLGTDAVLNEASAAVVIGSSAVAETVTPFTIALPITAASGIVETNANLVVIYKVTKADGTLSLGVIPTTEVTLEGSMAKFSAKNFGVFQAARSSVAVTSGKAVATSNPVTSLADLTPFFGVWKPLCHPDPEDDNYSDMVWLTISADGAVDEVKAYDNSTCSGEQASLLTTHYRYTVGKESTTETGAKEANVTIVGGSATALTDAKVTQYKAAAYCGFSDWQKGVAKDIANKSCGDRVLIPVGTTFYTIVEIEDGKLYFGLNEDGADSETPATRNVQLARDEYRTKQ